MYTCLECSIELTARRKKWCSNKCKMKNFTRMNSRRYQEQFQMRLNSRYKLVYQFKSQPCVDCKGTFRLECMDFDHVRGEKRFNIATAMTYSEKSLLTEIAKCDVICANCHRVRTIKRKYLC